MPPLGGPCQKCHKVWYIKTRIMSLPDVKKFDYMFSHFDTMSVCGQTDGQTGTHLVTAQLCSKNEC